MMKTQTENSNKRSSEEEVYQITWSGILIEITSSKMFKNSFPDLVHLEIQSKNRIAIPISETGYRSAFLQEDEISYHGGIIPYIQKWLEEDSNSKEWKKYEAESSQMQMNWA